MFRYETHVHTSEVSACAGAGGEKQAMFYKARGFDGIIITDHFLNGNTTVPRNLDWEERVRLFGRGYENAKKCGDRIGLNVFFGWEYSHYGTDFLTYGLDIEWLLRHPLVMEMDLNSYCDFVHDEGGIIVHAHPFREASYISMLRLIPRKCTGCEIINACRTDFENEMAEIYADKYGLLPFAGSDNHSAAQARLAGVQTSERVSDMKHFVSIIKSGNYSLFEDIAE